MHIRDTLLPLPYCLTVFDRISLYSLHFSLTRKLLSTLNLRFPGHKMLAEVVHFDILNPKETVSGKRAKGVTGNSSSSQFQSRSLKLSSSRAWTNRPWQPVGEPWTTQREFCKYSQYFDGMWSWQGSDGIIELTNRVIVRSWVEE
jgi:hypothetical protein